MKATGIIRRIDDLGRIVIPKEIRRTLKVHEGDPFEIYIDNDAVCFKKYSVFGDLLKEWVRKYLEFWTNVIDEDPVFDVVVVDGAGDLVHSTSRTLTTSTITQDDLREMAKDKVCIKTLNIRTPDIIIFESEICYDCGTPAAAVLLVGSKDDMGVPVNDIYKRYIKHVAAHISSCINGH